MALTNTQYESIIREYEEKQNKSRHELEQHLTVVRNTIPEYAGLEDAVSSLSVVFTRRLIDGEENARKELSKSLEALSMQKSQLLLSHGFPADYLKPAYECPDCQDTGYIGREKCHCFKKRMIDLLYRQSNLWGVLEQENFDTLSYQYFTGEDLVNYEKAVLSCKDFVSSFDRTHRNLLFTGTVGTGKTFLSNCIAKALIDTGHSVIYFSAVELFDTLSRNVWGKDKENLYHFYDDIYNCDLVIIDDLGTEMLNTFVTSYFFSFLNERQIRQKSTLISTNLGLKELNDRYSERICSRIIGNYEICVLTGSNIRIQKKT